MSNLELKGGILEMIATINDRVALEELKELVTNFTGSHAQGDNYWDELSETEQSELKVAIRESENEENLVPHKEVMKKYSKWLDK